MQEVGDELVCEVSEIAGIVWSSSRLQSAGRTCVRGSGTDVCGSCEWQRSSAAVPRLEAEEEVQLSSGSALRPLAACVCAHHRYQCPWPTLALSACKQALQSSAVQWSAGLLAEMVGVVSERRRRCTVGQSW